MKNKLIIKYILILLLLFPVSVLNDDLIGGGEYDKKLKSLTSEELIIELFNVNQADIGFHPTAWFTGFLALENDFEFSGGIIGSKKPQSHPALKELVKRGIESLPILIKHIDDIRETKVIIERSSLGGTWHSDEYHSRYLIDSLKPKNVNQRKHEYIKSDYTLKIGDLCFVAIGQIVNRQLNANRYQPSGNYVINSPIDTPALATAIKEEWSLFTKEDHKLMLKEESSNPYDYLQFSALKRLSYYYPEDIEPIAIKLLNREPYNYDLVWDLIRNELVLENDETKWQKLLDQFKIKHGQNIYDSIPYWLHWIYWKTDFARDQKFLNGQKNAKIILDIFFPHYDFDKPKFFNASNINEFVNIYKSLRNLSSSKINAAIHHFMEESIKKNLIIPDYIGFEFYAKVLNHDEKEKYKEYLNKRVNDLESLYQEKIRQEEKKDSFQMRSHYRKLIREYKDKLNMEKK